MNLEIYNMNRGLHRLQTMNIAKISVNKVQGSQKPDFAIKGNYIIKIKTTVEGINHDNQGLGFFVIISSSSRVPVVIEVDRELRISVNQPTKNKLHLTQLTR